MRTELWAGLVLAAAVAAEAGETGPLLRAVKAGDLRAARAAIRTGANVNERDVLGSTPLAWAVHRDDLAVADALIAAKADANAANDYGIGPLTLACENGNAAMVQRLVQAGANPNARRSTGETALMACARTGVAAGVRALLARGAEADFKDPRTGQTALMWAADQDHPEAITVLLDAGADIRARSAVGYTPLLFAVRAGATAATSLLLDRGADVNDSVKPPKSGGDAAAPAPDPAVGVGASVLLVATLRGHWDVARTLLARGADPNASGMGFTALHWASGEWEADITGPFGAEGYRWLAALRPDKVDFVKALLAKGADPNARLTKAPPSLAFSLGSTLSIAGATPLILAANAGDVAVMRALISAGANPALTCNDGTTVLMAAAGLGRVVGESTASASASLDAVRLAVELGNDVRAENAGGETALHGAAYNGADPVARFLVDKGARVNARNRTHGYTPLSIAERFSGPSTGSNTVSHPATAALLRSLGGETGVEFEGTVTQIIAGCPSVTMLVMPPSMGAARYGRGHTVRMTTTTSITGGACADVHEGTTVTVKGTRDADYSISVSELTLRGAK